MHKGYYGISGNRFWLRGVLEPAMVRIDHDGAESLVEFASAVDAVTFAVGTRAARCLRFCETDPPCDGCFLIWKRRPSY